MTSAEKPAALDFLRERVAAGGWSTWDAAVADLYALSERGLTREDLYFIIGELGANPPAGVDDSVMDVVWDLGSHLIGQCNVRQIIRLHGDPEDPDALADSVLAQPWRFARPPQGSP